MPHKDHVVGARGGSMSGGMDQRRLLLERLNAVVGQLRACYSNSRFDPDMLVYDIWTAKDVLSHLTFWHESFARNVSDLSRNLKPTPLKGKLSDLNQAGVDAMHPCTLGAIMERFDSAQSIIQDHILNPEIDLIPYRRGSRDYGAEEHLEIVIKHISMHLRDVVKAQGF